MDRVTAALSAVLQAGGIIIGKPRDDIGRAAKGKRPIVRRNSAVERELKKPWLIGVQQGGSRVVKLYLTVTGSLVMELKDILLIKNRV